MKYRFLLLTLAALLLAGCNSKTENAATTGNSTGNTAGDGFKVALLTPGDINDEGWNQLAYEGLQAIEKEVGAKVAHQVTAGAADQQPALRDLADQGYNLIICHGYEYGDRVKEIAPSYPDTKFVVMAGNVTQAPNVASMIPKLEDATYLIGMAAGGMTERDVLGVIGGMKLPVIASTFDAFEQGAKASNPPVKYLRGYVGNFNDQNAAREAARTQIAQGADYLFHNADQAGKGVFNAAQAASGVFVFGSNRNQNDLAPDQCLASAIIEVPDAFVDVAREVKANTFEPKSYVLDLANGGVAVEWNSKLKDVVPPGLMEEIDAAEQQIKSGKLKIERKV